jgi:nucleotide-binding universal stress UspA family protein
MTESHTPVLPPRRILCAVAEGTLSDAAIRAAARLAERTGARTDLVHALEMPNLLATRFTREQVSGIAEDARKRRGDQLRGHFAHALEGVQIGGRTAAEALEVVVGDPARVVIEQAAGRGADMIVLGDNGHRRQLDFGGTARAVLAKADAHVWVQTRDTASVRRMLVPVDLSQSSLTALDGALSMAQALGASVRVLHVFEDWPAFAFGAAEAWVLPASFDRESLRQRAQSELERAMAEVDWRGVEHEVHCVDGSPVETILSAAQDADLIAMGTHGRTGLAAHLLGGVTYAILRRAHTPVLALRTGGGRFHL